MPNEPLPECGACQGTGTVIVQEKHWDDYGTRWARSYVLYAETECETCNGDGFVELPDDWVSPGYQFND